MAFDRWGMTEAEADRLLRLDAGTIAEEDLEDAEVEIVDALGWEPDPRNWRLTSGPPTTWSVAGRAFGRAIAYQAGWRRDHPADAGDVDAGKTGETFPDYGYTADRPRLAPGLRLADRTVQLLKRWGFVRSSGTSSPAASEPDLWKPLGGEI